MITEPTRGRGWKKNVQKKPIRAHDVLFVPSYYLNRVHEIKVPLLFPVTCGVQL